ncbi:MAG: VOC family protein [Pseudomonadota bacterium]
MSDSISPFHLAFPVRDLDETRAFYVGVLGCAQGRSSNTWTDFSLFGHQMSAHLGLQSGPAATGIVDGTEVPIPHFGVALSMADWETLAQRLEAATGIDWVIKPGKRFEGERGEQATLFIRDPSGNALEFKGFANRSEIFAT